MPLPAAEDLTADARRAATKIARGIPRVLNEIATGRADQETAT